MWTKLRPGIFEFLRGVASRFELYVYTMGAKRYAEEMVRLIDADGTLGLRGADRVIGKEDSTHNQTKSLDVVLGSEEIVLIIDDSPAVWPRHGEQLLVPRRYHFFASSARRDHSLAAEDPASAGYLALGTDEPIADGSGGLPALLRALTDVHTHFFASLPADANAPPPHVSASVRTVRARVLQGVTLLFSHVVPLDLAKQGRANEHAAWRLAVGLGAQVVDQVGPGVTHVVAGRAGTDKAKWARSQPGVHAVSLEWLAASGYQWRRCDERAFQVQAAAAAVKPEHLVGVGSSQLAPPQLDA